MNWQRKRSTCISIHKGVEGGHDMGETRGSSNTWRKEEMEELGQRQRYKMKNNGSVHVQSCPVCTCRKCIIRASRNVTFSVVTQQRIGVIIS